MTLSGSKVELTHDLGAEIQNVVVGKVLSMEHHPDRVMDSANSLSSASTLTNSLSHLRDRFIV